MGKQGKAAFKIGSTIAGLALAPFTGGLSIPASQIVGQLGSSLIPDNKPIKTHSLAIAPGNPMNSYSPIQTDKGYNVTEDIKENTKGQGLDVAADIMGSLASIAGNAITPSVPTTDIAKGVTGPTFNLSKGLGVTPPQTQLGAYYKSTLNKKPFQSNFNTKLSWQIQNSNQ